MLVCLLCDCLVTCRCLVLCVFCLMVGIAVVCLLDMWFGGIALRLIPWLGFVCLWTLGLPFAEGLV